MHTTLAVGKTVQEHFSPDRYLLIAMAFLLAGQGCVSKRENASRNIQAAWHVNNSAVEITQTSVDGELGI